VATLWPIGIGFTRHRIPDKLAPNLRLTRSMIRFFPLFVLAVAVAVAGCGADLDPTKNWSPERFYQEAKDKMAEGDYETAIKNFETLEARYPYGPYAEQAQLEIAYAYYKHDDPALAITAADRFIRLHPTHPNVDYAYYIKGLVNFKLERSLFDWLIGGNDDLSDRDPKGARDAYLSFKELVERFPHSRYAKDARARMTYLFDIQAKYEVQVARFYYERNAYVAAVNRCKYTLENYPRTPSTEDALGIETLAYIKMGMSKLADDNVRVIRLNFPKSRYLEEVQDTRSKIQAKG
jgi:outer membrane protein assembly factor BamD